MRPISPAAAEAIAERMRVLSQPVRVRLLDRLDDEGELTVGALANAVGESLHNTSQHLAILRAAGVVRRRHRGRAVAYALVDHSVMQIYAQVGAALADQASDLGEALTPE